MTRPEDQVVALLEHRWGRPVRLTDWLPVEPWSVARAAVRVGTRTERVVVKWVRDGAPGTRGFRGHPGQAAREHAALRFVADRVDDLVPEPLAVADGLLVMEDVSPRVPVHEQLLADPDDPVVQALEELVDLLAELHAGTSGSAAEFASYLPPGWSTFRASASDPVGDGTARHHAPAGLDVPGLGYRTGSAPRPGTEALVELDDLARRLGEPGELLAMSNGDAGPNNLLVAPGERGRLVDFEHGGFQHALTDLLSLYLPHPAWITATDPVGTGLEQRYRQSMAATSSAFTDDTAFGWELSAAALAYALDRLRRFEVCDDRPPGDPSRLQLLVTTESAAALATGRSAYPAIASWLRAVGAALRHRWPEVDLDIASLPEWLPRL